MKKIEWLEKYMTDAEQLIYQNEVEQGLVMLNELLYEEPGYGSLHNHLGWAYMYYTADAERAELHFKMAIRFAADFAPPYLHLGVLNIRQEKYGAAIRCMKDGLTKPQANKLALLQHMANAYELRGEWSMAIKTYKETIMASLVEPEIANMQAGIKRCRRKRFVSLFSGT